jgi:V8-like Glu-specific endopeptidase
MLSTKVKDPMTPEEVKKLKPIKAVKPENFSGTEKQLIDGPEIEIIDGLPYPKGTKAIGIPAGEKSFADEDLETDFFYPNHADFYYTPAEPKKTERPKFTDIDTFVSGKNEKTIFLPDGRKVYYSTAYPWRCVGRVESAMGSGSGVMIGPRHLLTCAHMIEWKPNNTTGWIKFTPMYYNGSAPYGSSYGIKTYYKYKVTGADGINSTEIQYDYVVVVLDRTIGASTGWMGSKSYTDSWDGKPLWTHAGYPADLTGTQRPTYQTGIALDGDSGSADDNESMTHKADIWPGQSGGPFWAYWDGNPYAVATQSAHNPANNFASGGLDLVSLVNQARTAFP